MTTLPPEPIPAPRIAWIIERLKKVQRENPRHFKFFQEIIVAITQIGTDFTNLVARAQSDEQLIAALQSQVTSLKSQVATLTASQVESPEDQAAETAAETFLASPAPTDSTGALTPPAATTAPATGS